MNLPDVLFVAVSAITVFIYYAVARVAKWSQRENVDLASITWEASQSVIWGLAILALRNGPDISYWAALPILPTALIYGAIADSPGMNLNIYGMLKDPKGIAVLSASAILFMIYLGYIVYNLLGKYALEIIIYFLPVLVYGIWLLIWINIPVRSTQYVFNKTGFTYTTTFNGVTKTHAETVGTPQTADRPSQYYLHHWMIALIGVFISKHPTIVSDLGLGIFWGIFIQELSSYGIDIPIFKPKV